MKKILSIVVAAVLVMSLAVINISAGCYSPAGECETQTTIKQADPSLVIKDGVIGEGEYEKIDVNHDADTTDLVLSFEKDELFANAQEFLPNVDFYMSWDSVHGLNVAVVATLLEEPKNLSFQPDNTYYEGDLGFPGDEFLFQFGMMFEVSDGKETILYRGISKNTETGEHLYGHYGVHGYTGALNQTAGTDYIVSISGKTVTYEISFPMKSVVPAAKLNGTAPVNDTELQFNISATGGSKGMLHLIENDERNTLGEASACYGVSLGDFGYMADNSGFSGERSNAKGYFTDETITAVNSQPEESDPPIDTDPDESDPPISTDPEETDPPISTDPDESNPDESNPDNTEPPVTDPDEPVVPNAPQTADAAVIAAVVSAVSAAGYAVSRKRR